AQKFLTDTAHKEWLDDRILVLEVGAHSNQQTAPEAVVRIPLQAGARRPEAGYTGVKIGEIEHRLETEIVIASREMATNRARSADRVAIGLWIVVGRVEPRMERRDVVLDQQIAEPGSRRGDVAGIERKVVRLVIDTVGVGREVLIRLVIAQKAA